MYCDDGLKKKKIRFYKRNMKLPIEIDWKSTMENQLD